MVSTEVVNLQLISRASNKELRLKNQVRSFRSEGVLAQLGIVDLIVTRRAAHRDIYEPNKEVKPAPALYLAKARHAKEVMSEVEEVDSAIRFAADTHPKVGRPGKKLHVVVTKYPEPQAVTTYGDRLDALSSYIFSMFGQFGKDESVLMRAGLGVVPWLDTLIGLVDVKSYVEYGRNPLPDIFAARDFLQFCAETHVGSDGSLNNTNLERSIAIAGATPQEDLIRFAIHNNIPVEVRGRSNNPLEEIDQIGDGFTPEVLRTMLEMILGLDYSSAAKSSTRTYYGGRRVSLLPYSRHRILWSAQDGQLASEYVGQYSLAI